MQSIQWTVTLAFCRLFLAAPIIAGLMMTACTPIRSADNPTAALQPIASKHIEKMYRLSPNLLSGGSPQNKAGFDQLRGLGVKTIISVDGATPDVKAANASGMRYVHLPIGYDGITRDRALQIGKAVATSPGKVFVHCHHGKHRGPTAAAIALMSTEAWSKERALGWMKRIETSPDYAGLWKTVQTFDVPNAAELDAVPADFDQAKPGTPMVRAMGAIEHHRSALQAAADRGFDKGSLKETAHTAVLLMEQYRELQRDEQARKLGNDFLLQMKRAEDNAMSLNKALKQLDQLKTATGKVQPKPSAAVRSLIKLIRTDCRRCHADYRN